MVELVPVQLGLNPVAVPLEPCKEILPATLLLLPKVVEEPVPVNLTSPPASTVIFEGAFTPLPKINTAPLFTVNVPVPAKVPFTVNVAPLFSVNAAFLVSVWLEATVPVPVRIKGLEKLKDLLIVNVLVVIVAEPLLFIVISPDPLVVKEANVTLVTLFMLIVKAPEELIVTAPFVAGITFPLQFGQRDVPVPAQYHAFVPFPLIV